MVGTKGSAPRTALALYSGEHLLNAFTPNIGSTLTFGVSGEGVTIDPATGLLTVLTESLLKGMSVAVTAADSAGVETGRFVLTIAMAETDVPAVAPVCVVLPSLGGEARIGAPVVLEPGTWTGSPAPELAYQWLIDGEAIAGATVGTYVPVAADDRRALSCRVTATNAAGQAESATEPLPVTYLPPVASGDLPDLVLEAGSGPCRVEAAPVFAGEALAFAVSGADATIGAETGLITIPTDTPIEKTAVTVTAVNSGGATEKSFGVTVAAADIPPALVEAPVLVGKAVIGSELAVSAGEWTGLPAPDLTYQWRCGGKDIASATGSAYSPVSEEEGMALTCRVTATNAAGSSAAETPAVTVHHAAPVAAMPVADVELVQGTAPKQVEAAASFVGQALVFAVQGAGASIDPATGRVTLSTDVIGTRTVTVTATNSGGAAEIAFRVTVTRSGLPQAPEVIGVLGDALFEQGALATVSAQAGFVGEGLLYALEAAPAGATIDGVSGLVRIPTSEPIERAEVVVRATNAAGSATQTFLVSVRTNATVFDAPAKLAELGFINKAGAPASWTVEKDGYARLVTDPTDRNHGDWVHARGDGLYRCLARWNGPDTSVDWLRPFTFTARAAQAGTDLFGLRVDLYQRTGSNPQRLIEIYQYDGQGAGSSHTSLAALPTAGWEWNTWYWIEMELDGPAIRTRFYPEGAPAPDWQLSATTTHLAPGAFGPGAFGRKGSSMMVDIRRLDYLPLARMRPAPLPAPVDADWNIDQIKVQA